jgi:hypothetical protein
MSAMKKLLFFPVFCFFLLFIQSVQSQNYPDEFSGLPLNPNRSVLFGKDIVINNLPDQDQQNAAICSAPNGWLYNIYCFDSIGVHYAAIMRSKDYGLSWQLLGNIKYYGGSNFIQKKLDIVVNGNIDSNQKLFIASLIHLWNGNGDVIQLTRYNCDTFAVESSLFYTVTPAYHDIAIAIDNDYPALGSNPTSIGLLYSTTGIKDSLIFLSSGDGGQTFNNRRVVAVSIKKIHKVALAYGRSSSQNTGRYYAAWEVDADTSSVVGNIYTAHSNPNFNSPFTTPVKLDGLDPSLTNLCRNPAIACQVNNVDNDSANLSEVVLFEKFNSSSGDYDVIGFSNKKAATGNTFTRLNVAATANNELQPDITFNPYDSTFMVTYYDSTIQKLPLIRKEQNIGNPDNWDVVSPGYNESFSLAAPNPKVRLNSNLKKAINAWIAKRSSGNGVALFDAPYIPSTGVTEQNPANVAWLIGAFPNPCNTYASVSFEMKKTERVVITLCNLVGQPAGTMTNQTYQPGLHSVKYDISVLPAGTYFYTLTAGTFSNTGKICVIR